MSAEIRCVTAMSQCLPVSKIAQRVAHARRLPLTKIRQAGAVVGQRVRTDAIWIPRDVQPRV